MNEQKLLEIIAEFTTYGPEELKEDMNFTDDLGIDSLDLAQIILSAESEFGVELADEAMENVATIGDALQMLREGMKE